MIRKSLAVLVGLVIMGLTGYSIQQREYLLTNSDIVYLELAPVDPRSIMQGDFMRLRFSASRDINSKEHDSDGYIVLQVAENRVATFDRIYDGGELAVDEKKMRYRIRNDRVKFATNAFFFQEGTADQYEQARYGEFRIDDKGDTILTAMRDENLNLMGVELN